MCPDIEYSSHSPCVKSGVAVAFPYPRVEQRSTACTCARLSLDNWSLPSLATSQRLSKDAHLLCKDYDCHYKRHQCLAGHLVFVVELLSQLTEGLAILAYTRRRPACTKLDDLFVSLALYLSVYQLRREREGPSPHWAADAERRSTKQGGSRQQSPTACILAAASLST